MIWYILSFVLGLLVGWNFLKQPEWVRRIVSRGTDVATDAADSVGDWASEHTPNWGRDNSSSNSDD